MTRLSLLVLAVLFASLLPAPVATASLTRSSLMGRPRSSIHMRAPPAPQQNVRLPWRGISTVTFEPTETREDSPRGCTGPPSTLSDGVFVGTIQFAGEGGYVQIEETRVKGSLDVWRESEWKCPHHKQPPAPQVSREAPEAEKEPASLFAYRRGCSCFFAAYTERSRKNRGPTFFVGAKFEKREGMEITRVTYAKARRSRFVFDHAAGTATVKPPQPFDGHGTFKRRPHGRDLWRSTIRVSLLGAEHLDLRGRGSHARLIRDLPSD